MELIVFCIFATLLNSAQATNPSKHGRIGKSSGVENRGVLAPHPNLNPNHPLGPSFTSSFQRNVVSLNTKTTLIQCTAYARPVATIEWLWCNEKASQGDRGKHSDACDNGNSNWVPVVRSNSDMLQQLSNGSLKVSQFSAEKERLHVYRLACRASNNIGTIISPEIHIRPVVPVLYQLYTIQLADVYTSEGNTAIFTCNINPYFMPEFIEVVAWQAENDDVVASGGRFSVLDHEDLKNGKLHVREVTESDAYKKFRCLTRNNLTGKEKSSDAAHLIVIEASNSPPRMIDHVTSISAIQGTAVELPCVAIAIPRAEYSWSKNGVPIRPHDDDKSSSGGKILKLVGGNLLIDNVQEEDAGDYRCVAENYIDHQGTSVKLGVSAPISVHVEPQLQTVDSGKDALLHCRVEGYPIRSVRWLKDGKMLKVEDGGKQNLTLKVKEVKRSDAGMYQCIVVGDNNDVVHASAQISLGSFPPFIINSLTSEYLDPGKRISMVCVAMGNPTPTIVWSVDGELLPVGKQGDRISVGEHLDENQAVVSHVNITGLKVQDGGEFECKATNRIGSDIRRASLNILGVPIIKPMKNVTAIAGSELKINCRVTGYPVKDVFWKKDRILLPTNHRQAVFSNGTLLVSPLNRQVDEGWYSCHVVNPSDQGMERRFYVRVIDPPKIDPFHFTPRKQGDRVSVSCVMSSGDLPMTLEWRKDGDVIDVDLGVQIHQSGSYTSFLSIEYATPKHNGNYTCLVTNEGATTNHTSLLHIDVPPIWISEPEDTSVILSQGSVINCQARGDPQPRMIWRKSVGGLKNSYQDLDIEEGEESRVNHLSNGSLVIRSVVKEDQGFYLCHASNNIGPDLSKVVHLTVNVPANFKIHDSNVTASSGEPATLECRSEGDLPTSLSWSFSGRSAAELTLDKRYKVTYFSTDKGQGSRFTIDHVKREDSGFYVCAAKNSFGTDEASIHLTVLEKPDAPTDLVVAKEGSHWLELKWEVGFDGNSKAIEYQVEIFKEEDSWNKPFMSIDVEAPETSVRVENLTPATLYEARVRARNVVGFSNPSQVVSFTTLESEPSTPPLNVSAVAVGPQSILVMWQPIPKSHENGRMIGYSVGYKKVNESGPYFYATVANGNGHQLDNLDKFSTYSVHVQAFNRKGTGPKSDDVTVMTLEDVPSHAPVNVVIVSHASTTIDVSWDPPPLPSLNGVLNGFKVVYKYVREDEDESDSMSQRTDKLRTTLSNLRKFTNYSIQVLAYTKIGEGIASPPIYVQTLEDVPDAPADVKVLVANLSSVMVVWKPPQQINGHLTKYFINVTQLGSGKLQQIQYEVPPNQQRHLFTNLKPNQPYSFKVGASTRIGSSKTTKETIVQTLNEARAKIAGFSSTLYSQWHNAVSIDCLAVGVPEPSLTWEKENTRISVADSSEVASDHPNFSNNLQRNQLDAISRNSKKKKIEKYEILSNGTLVIHDVKGVDASVYKCRAHNAYGSDEIATTLIVQASPSPPLLSVAAVTSSSVQVSWKTTNNGGSRIQGFRLYKRLDHSDWSHVDLDTSNRSHLMSDLLCGSSYSFYIQAFNRMGMGLPSETISAKTEGSAPIIPPQSMILQGVNSTSATLHLTTWQDGGCLITSFEVSYQVADDRSWRSVQKGIPANTTTLTVTLNPGTWYLMRVTAHNDAGSTECLLRFSTLTYQRESTLEPQHLVRRVGDFSFLVMLQKLHVAIPAFVALVVVITVLAVAIGLFCYRRNNLKRSLDADKTNIGLKVDMVVDDDITADQNEINEYEILNKERVMGGKRVMKKEEMNLLRGERDPRELHAVVIETVTGENDDDDDDDQNLQWFAGIPRDGFPDGSELQTAKNSSDDVRCCINPPSLSHTVTSATSPMSCTCNVDSGHSTLITASERGGGEGCRALDPLSLAHHHYHRHHPPPCVLKLGHDPRPSNLAQFQESLNESVVPTTFQRGNRTRVGPSGQHHPAYGYEPVNQGHCTGGEGFFNQPVCTCHHNNEYSSANRMSAGSDVSFPPPPPSDYLSQHSSDVHNTPTDSLFTSPTSSDMAAPSEVSFFLLPPPHRRCDVIT